ncbi:MAG: hypothetical protein ACU84Q_09295 [Gammaproteobacteria bacterium]
MSIKSKHPLLLLGFFGALIFLAPVHGKNMSEHAEEISGGVFTQLERQLIREYYQQRNSEPDTNHGGQNTGKKHKHKHAKEKGRGNPKGLPPGIAMKLERGGVMPPGIAKRFLPADLEHRLPPRNRYRRLETAAQVILVDIVTDVIVDIIDIVFD